MRARNSSAQAVTINNVGKQQQLFCLCAVAKSARTKVDHLLKEHARVVQHECYTTWLRDTKCEDERYMYQNQYDGLSCKSIGANRLHY